MRNFFLMLKIRLDEKFEISSTFTQKDPQKKVYMVFQRILMLAILAIVFVALKFFANYLAAAGLGETLPILGYYAAVLVTFLVTVFGIYEDFSGNEDSEYLLSMPFSGAVQVFVMFVMLYVKNLLFCLIIELPFYMTYREAVGTDLHVGTWIVGLLFTSLPISGIAVLIGMFVILCLVSNQYKEQIITGVTVLVITIAVAFILVMADRIYMVSTGQVVYDGVSVSQGFLKEICKNFRFGRFYQMGIVDGSVPYIILFMFISFIWYGVFLFFHTVAYRHIITALRSPMAYGEMSREKVVARLKVTQAKTAMLRKEAAQFFRSRRYILQAAFGLVLALAIAVNFVVIGTEGFQEYSKYVPVFLCLCVGISNIAYCAMSMEGKRNWIINTSPLSKKELRQAKSKINIYLVAPVVIIAGVLLGVAFQVNVLVMILYFVLPIAYLFVLVLYSGWMGSTFASFNYESEDMAMHRGVPFLFAYVPGVVIPIVVALLMYCI